jgi:hypothetical protein
MNYCAVLAKGWIPCSKFVFGSAGERLVYSTNRKQKTGQQIV